MFDFIRKLLSNNYNYSKVESPITHMEHPCKKSEHYIVDPRLRSFMIDEAINDAKFMGTISCFNETIESNLRKFSFDKDFVKELLEKAEFERPNFIDILKSKDFNEGASSNFWTLNNNSLRKAQAREYTAWLQGFLDSGGKPTHYYDYPMPDDFYIATGKVTIFPLYGSASINIIVPEGITIETGNLGHINLYFMKDFDYRGDWIPIYTDTATICVKDNIEA